jgi:hypothetical protein
MDPEHILEEAYRTVGPTIGPRGGDVLVVSDTGSVTITNSSTTALLSTLNKQSNDSVVDHKTIVFKKWIIDQCSDHHAKYGDGVGCLITMLYQGWKYLNHKVLLQKSTNMNEKVLHAKVFALLPIWLCSSKSSINDNKSSLQALRIHERVNNNSTQLLMRGSIASLQEEKNHDPSFISWRLISDVVRTAIGGNLGLSSGNNLNTLILKWFQKSLCSKEDAKDDDHNLVVVNKDIIMNGVDIMDNVDYAVEVDLFHHVVSDCLSRWRWIFI